jgi:hypothetical protein
MINEVMMSKRVRSLASLVLLRLVENLRDAWNSAVVSAHYCSIIVSTTIYTSIIAPSRDGELCSSCEELT